MLVRSLIGILFFILCTNIFAQTSGSDQNKIKTIAGTLAIEKIGHAARANGITFEVNLNSQKFDRLYGSHYSYYEDHANSDGATRILMEDFVGGFSDMPSIFIYDFRGKAPNISHVSDQLDVDDVRWTSSAVFLSANGKWYRFYKGTLHQSSLPKNLVSESR